MKLLQLYILHHRQFQLASAFLSERLVDCMTQGRKTGRTALEEMEPQTAAAAAACPSLSVSRTSLRYSCVRTSMNNWMAC